MTAQSEQSAPNVVAIRAATNASPEMGRVLQEQSVYDLINEYQGRLNPLIVSQIIRQADSGRPRQFVDMVHSFRRKDGKIHACFQARELAIKSLEWDVVAPEEAWGVGKSKINKSKKAAAELKAALKAADNFPDLTAHLTGEGVLFGRPFAETMWETIGGHLWPVRWEQVNSRRFLFRQRDSKLLFDPTSREDETQGIDLHEEFPGKFVSYFPRINGDDLIREGLGAQVCWMGLFRNAATRSVLEASDSTWKPKRLGSYQKGAAQQDIDLLKRAMTELAANGRAAIPDTVKIEDLWPKGTASKSTSHIDLIGHFGREVAMATLGSTDIIEPGENGARSAVEVRAELRKDIKESEALGLSKALTQHISEPFTRLNYGEDVPAPMIIFLTEDPTDLKAFSESVINLRKAGLPIPQSYVYDRTGFAEPKEGEPLLGDPAPGREAEEPKDSPDDKPPEDNADDEDAKAA